MFMCFGKTVLTESTLCDWEIFFVSLVNCVAFPKGVKLINAETKNIAFIRFLIFKMISKLNKINLEDFLNLFY